LHHLSRANKRKCENADYVRLPSDLLSNLPHLHRIVGGSGRVS
jgi:hypothetical protein